MKKKRKRKKKSYVSTSYYFVYNHPKLSSGLTILSPHVEVQY